MIWMAVTFDEYELPIAVAGTAMELAKQMHVSKNTITSKESRFRRGIYKCVNPTKRTCYGENYKVVKVIDTEDQP